MCTNFRDQHTNIQHRPEAPTHTNTQTHTHNAWAWGGLLACECLQIAGYAASAHMWTSIQ